MEPLDDREELSNLLKKWPAPAAPASLRRRVFRPRPWWRRTPVAVAAGIAVLVLVFGYYRASELASESPAAPRDFTAQDADLRIQSPQLRINGILDKSSLAFRGEVSGPVVWLHAADRGRYILSLTPNQEFGLRPAGVVRGRSLSFMLGTDKFTLSSAAGIAPGDAAFNLYVLHDPSWRPVSAKPDAFLMGSATRAEWLAIQEAQQVRFNLVWVDRAGTEQAQSTRAMSFYSPRMSPDGMRIAVGVLSGVQSPPSSDIWIADVARGTLARITFNGASGFPVWTPDGQRLIYLTWSQSGVELRSQSADGTGAPEILRAAANEVDLPESISPDGRLLLGHRLGSPSEGGTAWILPLSAGSGSSAEPRIFLRHPFTFESMQFSPDGRWVAYASDESGRDEIYVQPYPEPTGKWQISSSGGTAPRWSRSGREIFYRSGTKMMAVEVRTLPTLAFGPPNFLFEGRYDPVYYDVTPDGQRFVMLKPSGGFPSQMNQVRMLESWFREPNHGAPAPK